MKHLNELTGLQIISWLAPLKLSSQTYVCSAISHFWLDQHRLSLSAKKVLLPLPMLYKYETSKFSKHFLYISIGVNGWKVERMVQQIQSHIYASLLLLQFNVLHLFLTRHCLLTRRYLQPWLRRFTSWNLNNMVWL